jgi:hypothetical protein
VERTELVLALGVQNVSDAMPTLDMTRASVPMAVPIA